MGSSWLDHHPCLGEQNLGQSIRQTAEDTSGSVWHRLEAFQDNYIWVVHDHHTDHCMVVDPGDPKVVMDFLDARGWRLNSILNTHHHPDHVAGNRQLKARYGAEVYGGLKDASRIPGITHSLSEGDQIVVGSYGFCVLEVDGHTRGHIAYHEPDQGWLFCGDALFSLGCGRMFEGTPAMMVTSLHKIKSLPPETLVFCAHEYTRTNTEFCLSLDPQNLKLKEFYHRVLAQRDAGGATIPSLLATEKVLNPFLRLDDPIFLQQPGIPERFRSCESGFLGQQKLFHWLRQQKDRFKVKVPY